MLSIFRRSGRSGEPETSSPENFVQNRTDADVVIDVRTPQEFASGHVAGAVNLNVHDPAFQSEIQRFDREGRYYVYCRSGSRSGSAVRLMRKMGFDRAYNAGGLSALARAGAAIER